MISDAVFSIYLGEGGGTIAGDGLLFVLACLHVYFNLLKVK